MRTSLGRRSLPRPSTPTSPGVGSIRREVQSRRVVPQFLVVRIGGLLLFLLFLFGVIESETWPWKVFFLILTVALVVAAVRL